MCVVLASSGALALSEPPTPSPALDSVRLYVGQAARLTAEIPGKWEPDRSLTADYSGPDGFIASRAIVLPSDVIPSLNATCNRTADLNAFENEGLVKHVTWREMPACIIESQEDRTNGPIALVFAHPDPAEDGHNSYVAVTADTDHFWQVTATISFDQSIITPTVFLDATIDFIATRSLWRDALYWPSVRTEARRLLGDEAEGPDLSVALPAIQYVFDSLYAAGADYHHWLSTHTQGAALPDYPYVSPSGVPLEGGIGYVGVPGFLSDAQSAARFAGEIAEIVADQRAHATCGWIVDLRRDNGGNMYPILAGLAAIIGPGTVAEFRDANGDITRVELGKDGTLKLIAGSYGDEFLAYSSITSTSDWSHSSVQPVAVLIGGVTASTGEAVAIAFTYREGTRFFGEPTARYATSPTYLRLWDGSLLSVATHWTAGPRGATYPNGVHPDVVGSPANVVFDPIDEDPIVLAAAAWLAGLEECRSVEAVSAS